MADHLEGRLLEVCNCRVLCPCWIGEDPDFGTCDSIVSWHFDKGIIDDVDVSDPTLAAVCHIPGNVQARNWRAGAPVFVGMAPSYKSRNAALGINVDIQNHNALQSTFVFNG